MLLCYQKAQDHQNSEAIPVNQYEQIYLMFRFSWPKHENERHFDVKHAKSTPALRILKPNLISTLVIAAAQKKMIIAPSVQVTLKPLKLYSNHKVTQRT